MMIEPTEAEMAAACKIACSYSDESGIPDPSNDDEMNEDAITIAIHTRLRWTTDKPTEIIADVLFELRVGEGKLFGKAYPAEDADDGAGFYSAGIWYRFEDVKRWAGPVADPLEEDA